MRRFAAAALFAAADLEILPDGSLAVSDDAAGAIYCIAYTPPR